MFPMIFSPSPLLPLCFVFSFWSSSSSSSSAPADLPGLSLAGAFFAFLEERGRPLCAHVLAHYYQLN